MSVKRPLSETGSETVPCVTEDYNHTVLKRERMTCSGFGHNGKEEKMELEETAVTSSIETVDELFASLGCDDEDIKATKKLIGKTTLDALKQFVVG